MHSLRHAIGAAALAALAVTSITACNKNDLAAGQSSGNGKGSTVTTTAAPTTTTVPVTTTTTAPTATTTTLTSTTTLAPTSTIAPTSSLAPTSASKPSSPRVTPTTTAAPPPAGSSVAEQVLARVNAERAKVGCKAVTLDARLTKAATLHSQDMAAQNYFSHTSKDGRSFVDRIKATGYPKPRSENIAAGQPTPQAVMDAWMNSAGHKANILDCTATQMGLGTANGGSYRIYWTQDFGTA